MRRIAGVVGVIAVGLLLGFLARLIWPRPSPPVYVVAPDQGAS